MDNVETTAGDIDLLMQGTGLLALASRAGQPPVVEVAMYQHCLWQIEDNQTAKGGLNTSPKRSNFPAVFV